MLVHLILECSKTFPAAVGFTVLVYDLLLTFGDEVQYIWRQPVTNIKVLYFILRYGVAVAQAVYFQGESAPQTSVLDCSHRFCSDKRLDITRVTRRECPFVFLRPSPS